MMVQSAFFEAGSVLASLVRLLSQEKMAVSRQAEPRVEIFYFLPSAFFRTAPCYGGGK